MVKQDLIIGIDAGTSVIKAVAFTLNGRQVTSRSKRNTYKSLPNGGVEQNMLQTWTDTVAVLKELSESIQNCSRRCLALAVTAQGDGTWLINKDGEPVHDGWLWLDARAAETSRKLSESKESETIYRHTGTGINVCQMRTHLCWMKENTPNLLKMSSTALHCKDWIYFKLTGIHATDLSEGGFTFGDFKSREYSDEVIEALGLNEFKHLLPEMLDGTKSSHQLTVPASNEIGLPAGLPVCLGMVDVMCSALGAGLYDPEVKPGLTILGSTGMHMRFVRDKNSIELNDEQTGYTMPFPGTAYAQMQTTMAVTLNIDWILGLGVQILASQGVKKQLEDFLSVLDSILLNNPPSSVCYHPYISSAGERGPFTDSNARASFTGLDQSTSWNELIRAVCDGLVLAARDCYEVLGTIPGEIRLAGGAANSKALRMMLASALKTPVRTISQPEAGAAGAAMIAAVNQGIYNNLLDATFEWVNPLLQPKEAPIPDLTNTYNKMFNAFRESRQALTDIWKVQSNVRRSLRT